MYIDQVTNNKVKRFKESTGDYVSADVILGSNFKKGKEKEIN
jgi:hypothetical protein